MLGGGVRSVRANPRARLARATEGRPEGVTPASRPPEPTLTCAWGSRSCGSPIPRISSSFLLCKTSAFSSSASRSFVQHGRQPERQVTPRGRVGQPSRPGSFHNLTAPTNSESNPPRNATDSHSAPRAGIFREAGTFRPVPGRGIHDSITEYLEQSWESEGPGPKRCTTLAGRGSSARRIAAAPHGRRDGSAPVSGSGRTGPAPIPYGEAPRWMSSSPSSIACPPPRGG